MVSGAESTTYCLTAQNSPSTYGVARERLAAANTVAASSRTTNGSVHPCDSTKNPRGVSSSSAAAAGPTGPRGRQGHEHGRRADRQELRVAEVAGLFLDLAIGIDAVRSRLRAEHVGRERQQALNGG